ncbi:hypothetical protein ACTXT7_000741 [Hymenolepis weldensis]
MYQVLLGSSDVGSAYRKSNYPPSTDLILPRKWRSQSYHSIADNVITNEMKRHTVIVSVKVKHRNLEMARFLKVAKSFVCKVRKELLNESNRNESAATGKRKEHCQHSIDPQDT